MTSSLLSVTKKNSDFVKQLLAQMEEEKSNYCKESAYEGFFMQENKSFKCLPYPHHPPFEYSFLPNSIGVLLGSSLESLSLGFYSALGFFLLVNLCYYSILGFLFLPVLGSYNSTLGFHSVGKCKLETLKRQFWKWSPCTQAFPNDGKKKCNLISSDEKIMAKMMRAWMGQNTIVDDFCEGVEL